MMKKSNRVHQMTASSLLSNVQSNDEHLEANLCTMLQAVCAGLHLGCGEVGRVPHLSTISPHLRSSLVM